MMTRAFAASSAREICGIDPDPSTVIHPSLAADADAK
jgi:hypothetical protein